MEEMLQKLKEMMSPGFDWKAHYDNEGDGIEETFRQCYRWHDYRYSRREVKTFACGSVRLPDTPKSLYRVMFLLRPSFADFSDMYKTGTLVDFTSMDHRFYCSFQLFKYGAALYFGCPKECLIDEQEGQAMRITCGIPGVDNGVRCSDPLGNLFFEVATMALNFEHEVYGGNDFKV